MSKYCKVKSLWLVRHIGKGFAIALLYDLTYVVLYTYFLSITVLIIHYVVSFYLVTGASRGYAFVEYETEKGDSSFLRGITVMLTFLLIIHLLMVEIMLLIIIGSN